MRVIAGYIHAYIGERGSTSYGISLVSRCTSLRRHVTHRKTNSSLFNFYYISNHMDTTALSEKNYLGNDLLRNTMD